MSIGASPYFTVLTETKDFACLQLNGDALFNGTAIKCLKSEQVPALLQHLLDEHRLVQVIQSAASLHPYKVIFRKVVTEADLVDKLQRQGFL